MRIPEEVKGILETLNRGGFEGYAVGGCVRDAMLHRTPEDWDITTNAKPEDVKRLFRRTLDTGILHGTVTVMKGQAGYEVTTYRLDGGYSDGRHPDYVVFTPALKEDLGRRDFTINAMSCSADGEIIDLFDGQNDLQNGVIRCVGDPAERFLEDALRMLRAVRFSAQLNFQIEEKTWNALCNHAETIQKVSRERIFSELNKMLLSDHPEKMALLEVSGLGRFLDISSEQLFADERISRLPKLKPLRWAALCSKMSDIAAGQVLHKLKSDLETEKIVALLVNEMNEALPNNKADMRKKLSEIGEKRMEDVFVLKGAGFGEQDTELERFAAARMKEEILKDGDCISLKTLALSGRDLIAKGVSPGPELGALLSFLFRQVLINPEWNQREILLKKLEEKMRSETAC